ncbi:protein disulfide oxidoreductase [Rodentibacter caecimuris]|uniref:protein disulfide oxidoreductase n=1 Tax=Rodentibacter caecimuris TaxID=1796644 RepID=UPI0009840AF9
MKFRSIIKSAATFILTFFIISLFLDFLRRSEIPVNVNNIVLYNLQSQPLLLTQQEQQKPIILYFWGTWCSYCYYTSPAINQLSQEGHSIVSIALRSGSSQSVQQYLNEHKYSFVTVNDPYGKIAEQWQVQVTPTIIVLNKGKMEQVTTGWTSYWGLKVRLKLAEFFNYYTNFHSLDSI